MGRWDFGEDLSVSSLAAELVQNGLALSTKLTLGMSTHRPVLLDLQMASKTVRMYIPSSKLAEGGRGGMWGRTEREGGCVRLLLAIASDEPLRVGVVV